MPKLNHSAYRILIFIVGVIATISYRLVIVFSDYSLFWLDVSWYVGTVGFVWFFGHRWSVENRRDLLIEKLNLTTKIESGQTLNQEEKDALVYILRGLSTSLAKWNYIAIFVFSSLAIIYAVFNYFLKYFY